MRAMLSVIVGVVVSACSTDFHGANGRATFTVYSDDGTASALTQRSLAVGGRGFVAVIADVPVASFGVADTTVVGPPTTCAGGPDLHQAGYCLDALAPGSTMFFVYAGDMSEIDHQRVTAETVDRVVIASGWTGDGPTVLAGQTFSVHASALDASGTSLVGRNAIRFQLPTGVRDADSPSGCTSHENCVDFATAPDVALSGTVQLVTVGSAAQSFPLRVVPASAIDGLSASAASVSLHVGSSATVNYIVTAGATEVYGSPCTWSSDSIAVVTDAAPTLDQPPNGTLTITGASAGTTRVACTVNGVTTAVAVAVL